MPKGRREPEGRKEGGRQRTGEGGTWCGERTAGEREERMAEGLHSGVGVPGLAGWGSQEGKPICALCDQECGHPVHPLSWPPRGTTGLPGLRLLNSRQAQPQDGTTTPRARAEPQLPVNLQTLPDPSWEPGSGAPPQGRWCWPEGGRVREREGSKQSSSLVSPALPPGAPPHQPGLRQIRHRAGWGSRPGWTAPVRQDHVPTEGSPLPPSPVIEENGAEISFPENLLIPGSEAPLQQGWGQTQGPLCRLSRGTIPKATSSTQASWEPQARGRTDHSPGHPPGRCGN